MRRQSSRVAGLLPGPRLRGRDGGSGRRPWRLPDHVRHQRASLDVVKGASRSRRSAPRASKPMASAIAPTPRMPTAALRLRPVRCAPAGQRARRPPPCSNRPPSPIPATRRCSAAYGRALADNGNFAGRLRRAQPAPIRPTIPTGASFRCRAPRSIKLGQHEEARRYYASALKIVPRRAVGAVQSRPVLRAVAGSAARPRKRCAAPMPTPRADARVRQNLALVVGLQGRFAEAETIVKGRSAGRRGGGQRRLSAGDAEPQGQ